MRIVDRRSMLVVFAALAPRAGDPVSGTDASAVDVRGSEIGAVVASVASWSRPCDGPDADPWVTERRDLVVAYSELARFAIERYGEPVSCEGTVTMEFDGAKFGTLTLGFTGGIELDLETMPPESSVTTLRSAGGFEDEEEVRTALERHVSGIGLRIDWTTPEVRTEGAEVIRQYWDPEPGLNASAWLILAEGRLVAVRVSMAL